MKIISLLFLVGTVSCSAVRRAASTGDDDGDDKENKIHQLPKISNAVMDIVNRMEEHQRQIDEAYPKMEEDREKAKWAVMEGMRKVAQEQRGHKMQRVEEPYVSRVPLLNPKYNIPPIPDVVKPKDVDPKVPETSEGGVTDSPQGPDGKGKGTTKPKEDEYTDMPYTPDDEALDYDFYGTSPDGSLDTTEYYAGYDPGQTDPVNAATAGPGAPPPGDDVNDDKGDKTTTAGSSKDATTQPEPYELQDDDEGTTERDTSYDGWTEDPEDEDLESYDGWTENPDDDDLDTTTDGEMQDPPPFRPKTTVSPLEPDYDPNDNAEHTGGDVGSGQDPDESPGEDDGTENDGELERKRRNPKFGRVNPKFGRRNHKFGRHL